MNYPHAASAGTGPNPLPPELDTAQTKLVYLYLYAVGPRTTGELREALNIRLTTLFPVLRTLARQNHVRQEENTYRLVE